ncbi:MAG: protein-glutamate O-methyltransferase CheR [Deltaproteobacteria bacterium]|nr:protein-glutamate O-methyltransferase CheR [Deltaproteobacteria bacterium]
MKEDGHGLRLPPHSARLVRHISDDELKMLLDKVYRERGADFRNYKKASLARRVAKRLALTGSASIGDYCSALDSDASEYDRLLPILTIKVSEFFREPEVFYAVKRSLGALPEADAGVRAWCCGCASGDEPYSLAILRAEGLGAPALRRSAVFATDVDAEAVDRARIAEYREDALRNVPEALMNKHFFMSSNVFYKVNYTIRNLVRFGVLDIVKGHPISRVHLLFCRNLFIYFNRHLQEAAFKKLDYALRPGGLLVLGKAEQVPMRWAARYYAVGDNGLNVFRKGI